MNNKDFLEVIKASFKKFLTTGSNSNEKLKVLHGAIANDIIERLQDKNYSVYSLGFGKGKEGTINGRYIDKKVDITIMKNDKVIAGIGIKFVMQNYSQNSNNYFENMLGETANIRVKRIPYFQVFVILDKLPYYKDGGTIKKWEIFSKHNAEKYLKLSADDIDISTHTPTKTLLFVVHIEDIDTTILNRTNYTQYYMDNPNFEITMSSNYYGEFANSVVFNDYEKFIEKLIHYIRFMD